MTAAAEAGHSMEADPLLDTKDAAKRAGVKLATWSSYVARGYAPPADDPDADGLKYRRRPRWRQSTVDAFKDSRRGQGRRTDKLKARKEQQRRIAAELAERPPDLGVAMEDWLQANHNALLTVADLLVDHREALLAAAPDTQRQDLADAIDQAGEHMSGRPSRPLASAIQYALFLLRADGPIRLPTRWEVREVLNRHGRLRTEFNQLRDPGGAQ